MQQFDSKKDAKDIQKSICKPVELNKLINIIVSRSNSQRQLILYSYENLYKSSLINDVKPLVTTNFFKLFIALFHTSVDYDCYQLREAVAGFGTDRDTLIEILATRSNVRIMDIKRRYPELNNGKELTKEIESNTSGNLRSILLKLLECGRPIHDSLDEVECQKCAKNLYEAEKKKKGFEQEIINMFTEKSRKEFVRITQLYYKIYGKTILEAIEHLFSGDVKKVFKTIIYALLSPSEYFAYRINKAIKGFLTNNNVLIRTLVSRDEIDIGRIKKYYKQLFKKDLYTEINENFTGDYRNLLLALVGK
jgi:hypothetical protein